MFNKTIFKQSFKNNYKLWLILTAVMSLFLIMMTVVSSAYNVHAPEGAPPMSGGMMKFTMVDLYATMFYGSMGIIIMMIYCIAVGDKLVVSEVDKGTLAYTLNTPITRLEVIMTKAIYYVLSIFAMIVTITIVGIVASSIEAYGKLDIGKFILINLGLFLYSLAISGIVYFSSCFFNKMGNALVISAGVPLGFFVLSTLSGIKDLEFFKYLTLNTLYDTGNIIDGTGFIVPFVVLFVIAVVFYSAGVVKFLKKDLPL